MGIKRCGVNKEPVRDEMVIRARVSDRRDTRTDKQRRDDEERERRFHRERREAGLPRLNYGATITINVRDVTDEEAKRLHDALIDAAFAAVSDHVQPLDRPPVVSGSTYTTERSIYDEELSS